MELSAPRRGQNNRRPNNQLGSLNNTERRRQRDRPIYETGLPPRPQLRVTIGSQGTGDPNGTRPPLILSQPVIQEVPTPPVHSPGGGQWNRRGTAPRPANRWDATLPPIAGPSPNIRSMTNYNQQQTPLAATNPRRSQIPPLARPTLQVPRNNHNSWRSNQPGPQNSNNPGPSNYQNGQLTNNNLARRGRVKTRYPTRQNEEQAGQNGYTQPQQVDGRRLNRSTQATEVQSVSDPWVNPARSMWRPNPSPPPLIPASSARPLAPNPPVAAHTAGRVSTQTEPTSNVSDPFPHHRVVGCLIYDSRLPFPRPIPPVGPDVPFQTPIQHPVRVPTPQPETSSIVFPDVSQRIPTPNTWDGSVDEAFNYENWPVHIRPIPPHAATQPTASTSNRQLSSLLFPDPPLPRPSRSTGFQVPPPPPLLPPTPPPLLLPPTRAYHNFRRHNPLPNPWDFEDDSDSSTDSVSIADSLDLMRRRRSSPPVPAQPRASTSTRPRRSTASPCSICLDPPDEFPALCPTARCAHRSTVCAPCLEQHISHAVLSGGSTTVPCPEAGCGQTLEYSDVIRGAKNDKKCLARFETLLLRRMLAAEPNFVWCKNTACDWGQVHDSGADAPIVKCQVCHALSCFTHDVPWHSGLTCAQYDAQRAGLERETQENLASEAYIRQYAKMCPNKACNRKIEKNAGCDHMTCRPPIGCGHEFCWVCLADYGPIRSQGNHHHRPDCRYHAGNSSPEYTPYMPPIIVLPRYTPPTPPTPLTPPTPPIPIIIRVPSPPYVVPESPVPVYPRPLQRAPTPPRPSLPWWGWIFGRRRTASAV